MRSEKPIAEKIRIWTSQVADMDRKLNAIGRQSKNPEYRVSWNRRTRSGNTGHAQLTTDPAAIAQYLVMRNYLAGRAGLDYKGPEVYGLQI